MAEEQGQFDALLLNFLNPDNVIRTKSEQTFDTIPVENRVVFLLNSVCNAANGEEVRQMAAVLLRRLITNDFDEFYKKLNEAAQNQMKAQLLLAIQQECSLNLRKKVAEAAAEFAKHQIDDEANNLWPDFLRFLFECANSPNGVLKEVALHMFSCVPGIFGNQQSRYMNVIEQMLLQSLQDPSNPQVQHTAVKATTAFLVTHERENGVQKQLSSCLPPMLQVLSQTIEAQDDDTVLKNIVDLAESCPRFLRSHLEPLLFLMTKTVADTNVPDTWRHLCLEVIVTMAETAPATMRKLGSKHIGTVIPLILNMMVDLEEDPDWSTADDISEDDNESNPVIGESSLDRLACAIGGKVVLPLVIRCLQDLFASPNWTHRHAALMAVSAIGEGCHTQMESLLTEIVSGVLPYLQDPHPRVRYAACNALGQMATDFSPVFEKKFHEQVIPGLLELLGNNSEPRVQAHAGAALVNFFEECPKPVLAPYLDSIVAKLETVLTSKFKELIERGTKLVLEQVVVTLASVADTAEEKFVQYYDRFMPCLKYVIQNATTPELRLLRGKTIECVSLIGLAVGRDKFVSDASDVMEMLLKTQTEVGILSDDDPQLAYMISAWARICKILGKQFEPYLPYVMGPVLKAAALKPEITLLDSDDMKVVEGDDDWQFVSLGEQQNFGIKTAGLEEKATACQMLVCYARELKYGFATYTEEVVKLMVPMLKFYFHDTVRIAAAECLPYLLECAKIRGDEYVSNMWSYICPELLAALDSEPEKDVLSEHLHAFTQCVEILGRSALNEQSMSELIRILDSGMKEYFERSQERQEKRRDEDYDDLVEEELLDEDDEDVYLLSKTSDVIHGVFSVYKEDFLPCFEPLLPHFVRLLGPDRPWSDHQWALCVFDDLIEHGGPGCGKYQEYFLRPLRDALGSRSSEVRQAAAYGVGVLAQFGGDVFANACADFVTPLMEMIAQPNSREPENLTATENAISAVTKVLEHNASQISIPAILPHWLSWLPVWEDEDEAPHVYGFLCTLLEQNNPLLLGVDNCNLPHIVMVMAEAFAREAIAVDSDVGKRMIVLLSSLKTNENVFNACISQLPTPQQQEVLQKLLA